MITKPCITCHATGFAVSKLGPDRCEFCDGTFGGNPPDASNLPYLTKTVKLRLYNPNYDPENKKRCACGHLYERHFDTHDSAPDDPNCVAGCKYCSCNDFVLADKWFCNNCNSTIDTIRFGGRCGVCLSEDIRAVMEISHD